MGNQIGNIVNYIFAIIAFVIFIGIVIKAAVNILSKERQVEAIIVDKQSYDKIVYRKSQAPFTKKEYIITFNCGNKKRHFEVSELSYGNYKINQKGILSYKGNRLIDFK